MSARQLWGSYINQSQIRGYPTEGKVLQPDQIHHLSYSLTVQYASTHLRVQTVKERDWEKKKGEMEKEW